MPCTRSSVDRSARETSDMTTIVEDEERRDLDAFGPLEDVRDRRVDEHDRDRHERRPTDARCRHAVIATASAAELMSTSTPVAYAPPCASTLALEDDRDEDGDAGDDAATSGRLARAHSGAMP